MLRIRISYLFTLSLFFTLSLALVISLSGCGDGSSSNGRVLSVAGIYATSLDEPWNGVIHTSLLDVAADGDITYEYIEAIGYAPGAFEGALRRVIAEQRPDILIGDSFGNEAATRRVARDFPTIAFAFGMGDAPTAPNLSVFDNWIHEPAYLAGMLAGGLTRTDKIGVVGGYPVPEVNRLVNAFIAGARAVKPEVEALVTYLSSWYDPSAAALATQEQIAAGADIFFAERAGVIEVAAEAGLLACGNIVDQRNVSPRTVVTSALWSTRPIVDHLVSTVRAGTFAAEDLRFFSMLAAGGAALAPLNFGVVGGIPERLATRVSQTRAAIAQGDFVVPIDEAPPANALIK